MKTILQKVTKVVVLRTTMIVLFLAVLFTVQTQAKTTNITLTKDQISSLVSGKKGAISLTGLNESHKQRLVIEQSKRQAMFLKRDSLLRKRRICRAVIPGDDTTMGSGTSLRNVSRTSALTAGTSKTVNISSGDLSSALTYSKKKSISSLTVTETMDARDFIVDGIKYTTTGTTTVAVSSNSYSGNISIPSSVINSGSTYTVTSIGNVAFYGCTCLTSITIPNSVTSIGVCAFYFCTGLTSISIPNSVTSIEAGAFYNCTSLTSMSIPNSVTSIGTSAFFNCTDLTSIIISNSVISIGGGAFYNTAWYNSQPNGMVYAGKIAYTYKGTMPANTSVTLASGTTGIANSAFRSCDSLTSISIPTSVTSIGADAFYNCTGLTSMSIPNSVTSIGADAFYNTAWYDSQPNGMLYAGKVAYSYIGTMPANTSVTLKAGTTAIADNAFEYCYNLTSISIPNSVTSIGSNAFENYLYSINVDVDNTNYSSIDGVLFNKDKTTIICCPGGKHGAYVIPNSVTSIGDYAFYFCYGLTSISIPTSVTSIEAGAFFNCSGLTSISIPNSVILIGDDAFYGCSGLTSISIPNSVTSIGDVAFGVCFNLTSISIPTSVTSIGDYAFYFCTGLTTISIPTSVTSIGDYTFEYCTSLTSISIPNSVTSIGGHAFSNCSGLTSISIPNSVTSIGGYAFYNTAWYDSQANGMVYAGKVAYSYKGTMLANTSVTLNTGTTAIADNAFFDCTSLTSISIPNSVTSIGDDVFYDCSGLTSISIPASVTSIGSAAFYGCSGLTSISIPASVTSIGSAAFYGCSGLTSIYSYSKIPPIIHFMGYPTSDYDYYINTFYSVNKNNCTLYIPFGSKVAYQSSCGVWNDFTNIVEIKDLSLSADSINMAANRGIASVSVISNISWTASSDRSWLTVTPTSGNGNATLTFTVSENPTTTARTAIITISASGVNPQTVVVTQVAGAAILSVLDNTASIGADEGTASVSVISNTAWTVSSDQSWLTVSPISGDGNATLTFRAPANPTTTARTATITISASETNSQTVVVTQAAGAAILSVSDNTASIGAGEGTASVSVISNTAWTVSSEQSWLTVSPISGNGNATLTFRAPANPTTIARTATITISASGVNSQTVVVTQAAGTAILSVSDNTANIGVGEGTASVSVISNTAWTISSDKSWLTVSPISGDGNATLTFSAPANPTTTARTATITISASGVNPQTVVVTQVAGAAILLVSDNTASIGADEGTASVSVISNTAWTVSSDQSWLTVSPISGDGNATLTFRAPANPTTTARTATITISASGINSQAVVVTQAAMQLLQIATIAEKWSDVLVCYNTDNLFTAYQWYKNDAAISGATNQFYQETGGLNGSYYIKVTTNTGESGISNVISIGSSSKSMKVYPNPVRLSQDIQIEISNVYASDLEQAQLSISSIHGKSYCQRTGLQNQMQLRGLPQGCYLVQVHLATGEILNEKLIIN